MNNLLKPTWDEIVRPTLAEICDLTNMGIEIKELYRRSIVGHYYRVTITLSDLPMPAVFEDCKIYHLHSIEAHDKVGFVGCHFLHLRSAECPDRLRGIALKGPNTGHVDLIDFITEHKIEVTQLSTGAFLIKKPERR